MAKKLDYYAGFAGEMLSNDEVRDTHCRHRIPQTFQQRLPFQPDQTLGHTSHSRALASGEYQRTNAQGGIFGFVHGVLIPVLR